MDAGTLQRWLEAAAESLHEQRDYLTQLDAAIGDADHGANMDRGFAAVVEKLDGLDGITQIFTRHQIGIRVVVNYGLVLIRSSDAIDTKLTAFSG